MYSGVSAKDLSSGSNHSQPPLLLRRSAVTHQVVPPLGGHGPQLHGNIGATAYGSLLRSRRRSPVGTHTMQYRGYRSGGQPLQHPTCEKKGVVSLSEGHWLPITQCIEMVSTRSPRAVRVELEVSGKTSVKRNPGGGGPVVDLKSTTGSPAAAPRRVRDPCADGSLHRGTYNNSRRTDFVSTSSRIDARASGRMAPCCSASCVYPIAQSKSPS